MGCASFRDYAMNVSYATYDDSGLILFTGNVPESMLELQEGNIYVGVADSRTNYILNGELHTYTPEEQFVKDNLQSGWIWKMPERVAIDTRSASKKAMDNKEAILKKRRNMYPPLEDFADAYYWATNGDSSKMDAYLAKVEAVKAANPK